MGYFPENLVSDTFVDGSDGANCDNNAADYVTEISP